MYGAFPSPRRMHIFPVRQLPINEPSSDLGPRHPHPQSKAFEDSNQIRDSMKILIAVLLLSLLSGCATVDRASYPNIEFGKDDQVIRIDFRHMDVPEREVTIERCVEKHIANKDIDIKDRSTALGFILAGPVLIGLAIGDDDKVVEASDLILESSPSRVKVAGRIRFSEDSINPETLGFILTVEESERGMLYRYDNPQRIADIQAKGLL